MTSPFAASAVSRAPTLAEAEAQIVAKLTEALGQRKPEVVLLAATTHHAQDYSLLPSRISRAFSGANVIGCSTTGIMSRDGETEDEPGLAALAIGGLDAAPFLAAELKQHGAEIGRKLGKSFAELPSLGKLLLLMPDAYVGSLDPLLRSLASCYGPLPLAGGAPSEEGLGRTFQWGPEAVRVDPARPSIRTISGGLSGVFLSGAFEAIVTVAQGCEPIGSPMKVTEAAGTVVMSLDGTPALEAFISRLPGPLKGDLPRALSSVLFAVREGDTVITRHVVGIEAERQGLVLSEAIAEGAEVRLAIRDAASARADMRRELEATKARIGQRRIVCGIYFSCAGRGSSLHGIRDVDTSYIDGELGEFPWIGMHTSAEIALLGAGLHLFAYSGVLALVVA